LKQRIARYVFEDAQNYMKDGVLLRQVINVINEVDFSEYKERHEFGTIYETILKSLQSAGNAGEFYTPRAVTDFMVQMIAPKLGESVADFACGTGGFCGSLQAHHHSGHSVPESQEGEPRSGAGA
jgi:type I restriction enzyme M protein